VFNSNERNKLAPSWERPCFHLPRFSLYGNINQISVSSLYGMLNFKIDGLECRTIARSSV